MAWASCEIFGWMKSNLLCVNTICKLQSHIHLWPLVNSTSMAVEWVRGCVYKMSIKLLFCCLCFVNKGDIWPFSSSKKTNQQEHNFKNILGSKKQPANANFQVWQAKIKLLWWSTKWMKNSQPNLQDWYSFFFSSYHAPFCSISFHKSIIPKEKYYHKVPQL